MAERDSATPSASSPVEKVRAPALHGGDGSCGPRHAPGATAPACCRGLTPHGTRTPSSRRAPLPASASTFRRSPPMAAIKSWCSGGTRLRKRAGVVAAAAARARAIRPTSAMSCSNVGAPAHACSRVFLVKKSMCIRAACVQARSSDAVVIVPPALGRLRSSAWCRLKEVPRGTRAYNAHARDGRTRGEEKGEAADDARYHDAARHKSSVRYRRVPAPHTARTAHARPHPGSKTMKCTG